MLFTVLGAVIGTLWVISLIGIVDTDSIDSMLDGALDAVGLTKVPATILLAFVAISGWAATVLTQIYVSDHVGGPAAWLAAIGSTLGGAAIGTTAAIRVGPRLKTMFEPSMAHRAIDLVGRSAEVRSESVSAIGGYADSFLPDGTPARITVRTIPGCTETYRYGTQVLIVDYDSDSNTYLIDDLPTELAV